MVSFTTTPLPVTTPVVDRLELLRSQEELHQAWSDLTEAQKGMTEVQEIMENIQTSIAALTKYGQAAVEQLNVEGSLESLLQVPARLITAEKAQEGLVDTAKEMWDKFVNWVKQMISKLKEFISRFLPQKFKVAETKLLELKQSGATEGLIATEGIKLVDYCETFISGAEKTINEIESIGSNISHVFNSLDKASKRPADEKSRDQLKEELELIVFGKDSYFWKIKDAFTKLEELNEAGKYPEEFDDVKLPTASVDKLLKIVKDAKSKCVPLRTFIMDASRELAGMENLRKLYSNDGKQVEILNIFITGFKGCLDDALKCIRILNAVADRVIKITSTVKQ